MTLTTEWPIFEAERPIAANKHISMARAMLMLENAVVERGATHFYPNARICRYAVYDVAYDENTQMPEEHAVGAACIVGVGMKAMGFTDEHLATMDRVMGPFNKTAFEMAFPDWTITESAAIVLRAAQVAQDQQHPWGIVYARAMRAMFEQRENHG